MGFEAWKLAMKGSSDGMQRMRGSTKAAGGGSKGQSKKNSSSSDAKKKGSASRSKRKSNRSSSSTAAESGFDERKFRAEQDLRTLTEASEVLDSPERIKAAKSIAQERVEVARAAAESINKL